MADGANEANCPMMNGGGHANANLVATSLGVIAPSALAALAHISIISILSSLP